MIEKLKNLKIEKGTLIALGLVLATIVAIYGLSSGEERTQLLAAAGTVGAFVLAVLKALASAKGEDA